MARVEHAWVTATGAGLMVGMFVAPAFAQMPPRTPSPIHDDIQGEIGDANYRWQRHCAEVGLANCEREQREATAGAAAAVRAQEARDCEAMGPARCAAMRQAELDDERRAWMIDGGLVVALLIALWRVGRPRRMRAAIPITSAPALDVASLDVVVPHTRAGALRDAIASASASATATATLATSALPVIARVMLDASTEWTHVGVRSWPMTDASLGEDRFRAVREEVRARAALELPPVGLERANYRGTPAWSADRPPDAFVLVTLTILSTGQIPEATGTPAARATALLEAAAALPGHSVEAIEIAWLPESREDAYTAEDLIQRAPRLVAVASAPS